MAQGTPHEVISAPLQETVAQLSGFENVFDAVVDAVRPERGTMNCRIAADGGPVVLETPLVRGGVGSPVRVGIRAGDILLATSAPVGLSARNVIPGRIASLEQRDVIVSARVKCRVEMEVHLTLAARDSLQLAPGKRSLAGDQDPLVPLDAELKDLAQEQYKCLFPVISSCWNLGSSSATIAVRSFWWDR